MYYVLNRSYAKHPARIIGERPRIKGVKWCSGRRHTQPIPDPLLFELKPFNPHSRDESPEMPELFRSGILLFRDDLVKAVLAASVDNLDFYNVKIHDPDNGQDYTNYKAVNIIGVVSAADMEKSNATVHPGGPIIDVDFDGLVVDEKRARASGLLIFRLAESISTILVHQKLRDHLLSEGFTNLEFMNPEDCAL